MEKTIFEQMGGTYAQAGDYNSPNHKKYVAIKPILYSSSKKAAATDQLSPQWLLCLTSTFHPDHTTKRRKYQSFHAVF